jgi:hypothetical protein
VNYYSGSRMNCERRGVLGVSGDGRGRRDGTSVRAAAMILAAERQSGPRLKSEFPSI